jgi:tRNA uridine 5-carbamoylmethylation protein Kti12
MEKWEILKRKKLKEENKKVKPEILSKMQNKFSPPNGATSFSRMTFKRMAFIRMTTAD